jgi:hypothetical protein
MAYKIKSKKAREKRIASKVYADNRNKSIYVVYTDGSRGFFGFEKFDTK